MLNRSNQIRTGLLVAAAVLIYFLFFQDGSDKRAAFQGYMEGRLVLVGPEASGRIAKVFVAEGEDTEKDAPLFELESTYERAQMMQAKAVLAQAEAELNNLRASQMRSQEIDVLKAKERSALAAFQLSKDELQRKLLLYERRVVAKAVLDAAQTAFNRDKAVV